MYDRLFILHAISRKHPKNKDRTSKGKLVSDLQSQKENFVYLLFKASFLVVVVYGSLSYNRANFLSHIPPHNRRYQQRGFSKYSVTVFCIL